METENNTSGVAVYCKKCGKIIYAITDEHYRKDKKNRKEIEAYIYEGYSIGRVTKEEVQNNFGCKCSPDLFSVFE